MKMFDVRSIFEKEGCKQRPEKNGGVGQKRYLRERQKESPKQRP